MNKKEMLLKLITDQGILPLYFNKDSDVSIQILRALYNAGIRTVEYTNRGAAALENFKLMRSVCDTELKGMYLGIGTIKNGATAKAFIDAGADYLVCPGLVPEVAAVADAANFGRTEERDGTGSAGATRNLMHRSAPVAAQPMFAVTRRYVAATLVRSSRPLVF